MKRYLEFHDETSHKYWEIEVSGKTVTVHYGRVGTDGQKKTRTFESAETALQEAKKLIYSK